MKQFTAIAQAGDPAFSWAEPFTERRDAINHLINQFGLKGTKVASTLRQTGSAYVSGLPHGMMSDYLLKVVEVDA